MSGIKMPDAGHRNLTSSSVATDFPLLNFLLKRRSYHAHPIHQCAARRSARQRPPFDADTSDPPNHRRRDVSKRPRLQHPFLGRPDGALRRDRLRSLQQRCPLEVARLRLSVRPSDPPALPVRDDSSSSRAVQGMVRNPARFAEQNSRPSDTSNEPTAA